MPPTENMLDLFQYLVPEILTLSTYKILKQHAEVLEFALSEADQVWEGKCSFMIKKKQC
jgi:hypothetical protein